ncbi:hypothetical protein BJ170DRAFT_206578 [Xylariales sp. AK1849]|nr:hypothetical protein BJ170DRAFT_206578 [Xylariales sp. AK1849]
MAEWSVGHQAATFDRLSPNLGDTYDSLSMTSSDESANPKPVYPSRKGKKVYRREPGEVGLESSENLDDDNRSFDPSNDRMLFDAPHGQKDQASYGHFEPDDPHISMIPGQIQPEYSRATSKACNKVGLSKQSYERHLEGESSSVRTSSPYAQAPEYPTEEDSFDYGDPSSSRNSHKKVASHTKRMTSIPEDAIADKEGEVGYLDQEYKVEPSWKFHPGAVCKVLWSEPVGVPTAPGNQEGADFIVSYRRFIVVATDEGHHSTCVPILTYERKGCNKKGVKASQHGIIYSKGQSEPRRLKGEPTLGYPPVAVTMSVKERLPKESRVNYAKLVTIEHNVKVLFIGTVEDKYFETVEHAVNGCWETKERHQLTHKHSRHGKQPRK